MGSWRRNRLFEKRSVAGRFATSECSPPRIQPSVFLLRRKLSQATARRRIGSRGNASVPPQPRTPPSNIAAYRRIGIVLLALQTRQAGAMLQAAIGYTARSAATSPPDRRRDMGTAPLRRPRGGGRRPAWLGRQPSPNDPRCESSPREIIAGGRAVSVAIARSQTQSRRVV